MKQRYQPIYDIAEICVRKGVMQAIFCPGSRCAPLTIAFSRNHQITPRIFSDERSAAFVALGIAQQTRHPAILVCTSGSAAYNFAPAIAEAFYQHIPLLIFTADRPPEWVDQLDGQTIQQQGIYGSHVKKSFNLPEASDHADNPWFINRMVNDAINLAMAFPAGPVHINAPFREPLYPEKDTPITSSKSVRIIDHHPGQAGLEQEDQLELRKRFTSFDKILFVAGQDNVDESLLGIADKFTSRQHTPFVGDIISNFHGLASNIRYADSFLAQGGDALRETLQPELLVTFGKSVISKNLKLFLRQNKELQHWHLQEAGPVADTFQGLTKIIRCAPATFLDCLLNAPKKNSEFEIQKRENYFRLWEAEEHRTKRSIESFFSSPSLSELHLVREILQSLPEHCNLHLANSMSVRYANFIGLEAAKKGIHVYANRGTSGIEGCTSTSVGHTLSSDAPNFLITGDMAFFYDRNAFWHHYPLSNLRIILLNNHGGIIFNMIDGPADLPEKDEYFITRQSLTARSLAAEFGFDYLKWDSLAKVKYTLKDFYEFDGKTKILEIETDGALCKNIFEQFKRHIKKAYELSARS